MMYINATVLWLCECVLESMKIVYSKYFCYYTKYEAAVAGLSYALEDGSFHSPLCPFVTLAKIIANEGVGGSCVKLIYLDNRNKNNPLILNR